MIIGSDPSSGNNRQPRSVLNFIDIREAQIEDCSFNNEENIKIFHISNLNFEASYLNIRKQAYSIILKMRKIVKLDEYCNDSNFNNQNAKPADFSYEHTEWFKISHVFFRQFRIFTANSNSKRMPFFEYGLRMSLKPYFSEN